MFKLSDFISKPIISIYDGAIEGIIKSAIFDKKFNRLKCFIIFDEFDDIIEEKCLAINKIYSIGDDSIVIRNNACLEPIKGVEATFEKKNPINLSVYDSTGKYMGIISDLNFDDKFYVKSLVLDNLYEIQTVNFISSNKTVFIVQNTIKHISLNNFAPKNINSKLDKGEDVYILKSENEIIKEKIQKVFDAEFDSINDKQIILRDKKIDLQLPNKITSNVNFLVGRKATRNIYSPTNEVIVKKNSVINANNIEIIKKYGKLKELATFSI